MSIMFGLMMLLINIIALVAFNRLRALNSLSQIQAEVELEMHDRAHQLLVRRDQMEVGLIDGSVASLDEQWKGDLAEYMEEFEQEALLRAKNRLKRV